MINNMTALLVLSLAIASFLIVFTSAPETAQQFCESPSPPLLASQPTPLPTTSIPVADISRIEFLAPSLITDVTGLEFVNSLAATSLVTQPVHGFSYLVKKYVGYVTPIVSFLASCATLVAYCSRRSRRNCLNSSSSSISSGSSYIV